MYISKIQVFHGETEPLIPNMVRGIAKWKDASDADDLQVLYVEQPKPVAEKPEEKPQKEAKKRSLRKKSAKI